jgi:hypothetical protein
MSKLWSIICKEKPMKQIKKKKTLPVTTQIEVPCPKWLQKAILKNLKKTSKNRFCIVRAKRSLEILRVLGTKHDTHKATTHSEPSATTISIESEYLPKCVHTFASQLVNRIVYKSINHLRGFTAKFSTRRKVGSASLSGV